MPLFRRNLCNRGSPSLRRLTPLAAFLSALSLTVSAHAATYYVATNGSDSNPGTQAAPFKTIAKGSQAMKGGDTLYIRAGTYNESLNAGMHGFVFRNGSSWTNMTRYAAYPGEERKVILIPPASDDMLFNFGGNNVYSDTYMPGNPAYIEVSGFVFDASSNTGASGIMHSCLPVRLINNEIKNARIGISGGGCSQIIGNEIHHSKGYGIYGFPSYGLLERNIFHDNGGYGAHVFTQNHRINGWVIRNNVFYNNGNGFMFGSAWTPTPGGVPIFRQSPALLVSRGSHQVYNNLVYNNHGGIQAFSDTNDDLIANNTVYGNKTSGIIVDAKASKISVINNIVWGNGTNINDAGANTTLQNNLTSDPHVVNAAGGDFHLTSASTNAIDKGITQAAVPNDFDYGKRPFGAGYDIGAFEFGAPPDPSHPLLPIPAGTPATGTGSGSGSGGGLSNCAR